MPKKYIGKTPQQQLDDIRSALHALPLRIANLGLKHFKKNFDEGGWEGQKWVKRKDNLPHPLLQQTRKLYRSLAKEVRENRIRVFIAAPANIYGTAHNEGFRGTVAVRSKRGKAFTRRMNLPKRKFIGPSDKLDKAATQLVTDTITKLLQG